MDKPTPRELRQIADRVLSLGIGERDANGGYIVPESGCYGTDARTFLTSCLTISALTAELEHAQEVIDRVALIRLDVESENLRLKASLEEYVRLDRMGHVTRDTDGRCNHHFHMKREPEPCPNCGKTFKWVGGEMVFTNPVSDGLTPADVIDIQSGTISQQDELLNMYYERLETAMRLIRQLINPHESGFDGCPWCGIQVGEFHLESCQLRLAREFLNGKPPRALNEQCPQCGAEPYTCHRGSDCAMHSLTDLNEQEDT